MLLIGVKEENAWLISRWNLTYRVGWKQICKASYSVYDYYNGLEILIDNRAVNDIKKENILNVDESSSMTIRGMSTIVGIPIMITFYNQTNIVDINVAKATEEFKSADYQSFNKSLCQYLDSMEIAMHQ